MNILYVPVHWSSTVYGLLHRPCWIKADINTLEQFGETNKTYRHTDRQGERGETQCLYDPFPLKCLTVIQSHIYTRRIEASGNAPFILLLLAISGWTNESCCPTDSKGWVTKFKVLFIRFDQFSPSQLKPWEEKGTLFFLSKVKLLLIKICSARKKREWVNIHKGEEIDGKEGKRRLGMYWGIFLIAFKSLRIASHPAVPFIHRLAWVSPCPP